MDMTGKGVVITGASRGIGEATARMMAAAGAQVALLARNGDAVADIAGDIGPNALAIPCDVARYWEVEAAISAAAREFGSLDVVINNAGVIEPIASLPVCAIGCSTSSKSSMVKPAINCRRLASCGSRGWLALPDAFANNESICLARPIHCCQSHFATSASFSC